LWRWPALDETYIRFVAEQLRQAGLTHDVFEPGEIARDLAERTTFNESLDELIGSSDVAPAPASFQPEWSE
jgi:hypothetical protein